MYSFTFTAVIGMDGIFYDYYDGGHPGCHADAFFMSHSNVTNIMEEIQVGNEDQYWIYVDKGFANNDYVKRAYKGRITLEQQIVNNRMAALRVAV